jgi:hypothetical protein
MAQAHSTHKNTHEQLAPHMFRPVTTPREHTESKPRTTNYLLAAGSSMHYTPKVPKNNCQFQNKSMLSWETTLCVLLPRAGFVAEARREASSALLQCPPLHRRHASRTTKHEHSRTHGRKQPTDWTQLWR